MAGIETKTSADQPLTELQQFQRDLLALLEKYQHNRVVDANTKAYQDDIIKTLKQVNKMVASGKLSTKDTKTLEKLMNVTEKQYDNMKTANSGDKQFQKNFVKVFGTKPMEGSLAKMMVQHMGKSLRQFQQTLSQATAPIAKNAKDTALFGVTGPFGAMAEQAIDWSSIKQHIKQGHQNRVANRQAKQQRLSDQYSSNIGGLNDSIKGIFAGGHSSVPDTGSYYLHQGERVVAPEQNKDLSTFLDQMQGRGGPQSTASSSLMKDIDDNVKRTTKLLEVETATSYFDPLIENEDRLYLMGQRDKYRFDKRLFRNLEVLSFGVYGIGTSVTGAFIKFGLKFERFMRHPFFYSADFILKPFQTGFGKLFHEFFPKKEDEEAKIYNKLDDIYEYMKDKGNKSHKTWGQRFLKHTIETLGGGAINLGYKIATAGKGRAFTLHTAQRIQEEIEARGHRHGWGGVMDRLHLMGYDKYLNKEKMSDEAEKADAAYKPTGYMRDIRFAKRHQLKSGGIYHVLSMLGIMNDKEIARDGITIKHTLRDKLDKIREKYLIHPVKHAFAQQARAEVHANNMVGRWAKHFIPTTEANQAYVNRGLYGVPGQKRDAKGRFLPHQIGLFGHAKNYMKDIYHTLRGTRKDNKKHHKGLFGTLLSALFLGSRLLLSGLRNIIPSVLAGLGITKLFKWIGGILLSVGTFLKGIVSKIFDSKILRTIFGIGEDGVIPAIGTAATGVGLMVYPSKLGSNDVGHMGPNGWVSGGTPVIQKQSAATRTFGAGKTAAHKLAEALLHNPYVADAAAVTAIGAGTADYQAHRAMVAGKHMYNKNVAPALTNAKTAAEAESIKALHQIRDGVDKLAPVVKKSGDDLLRTSKTHIAATLAAAKSNAPAEEEMLMAKVHSWYGYTLGTYNALR